MIWVAISFPISFFGVWLCYRSTRNVFSPIFLAALFWFSSYLGGLQYWVILGHYLTPLYISLGELFFGIGASMAKTRHRFSAHQELSIFRDSILLNPFNYRTNIAFVTMIIISVIYIMLSMLLFYYGGIPLLQPKGMTGPARALLRINRGIYVRSLTIFLPIIMGIWLIWWRRSRKHGARCWFILVTAVAIGGQVLWASRGGILMLFLYLLILIMLASRPNKKVIMLSFILIIIALSAAAIINSSYRNSDIITSFGTVFERITLGQAEGIDYIIYGLVPKEGLSYGKVIWQDIKGLLAFLRIIPYEPSFNILLFWNKCPKETYPFSLNTALIGDLYADYHVIGVITGLWILGFFMETLYIRMLRRPKDYLSFPLRVYIQFAFAGAALGGGLFSVSVTNAITALLTMFSILLVYTIISLPTGRILIWLNRRTDSKRLNS